MHGITHQFTVLRGQNDVHAFFFYGKSHKYSPKLDKFMLYEFSF